MNDDNEGCLVIGLMVLSIVVAVAIGAFCAKEKSVAYNRITGQNTTWWDALWVPLIINGGEKK